MKEAEKKLSQDRDELQDEKGRFDKRVEEKAKIRVDEILSEWRKEFQAKYDKDLKRLQDRYDRTERELKEIYGNLSQAGQEKAGELRRKLDQ